MADQFHALWLFAHLAGAIVWLGGMVFAHFSLRPVAAALLEPPARLSLMAQVLGRFFRLVMVAVLVILLSGGLLLSRVGLAQAPLGWHVMLAVGVVMAGVFAFIHAVPFTALRRQVAAQQWPAASASLNGIRRLVLVNMCLGFVTVAAAALARW